MVDHVNEKTAVPSEESQAQNNWLGQFSLMTLTKGSLLQYIIYLTEASDLKTWVRRLRLLVIH
jgi:hypothetical protein